MLLQGRSEACKLTSRALHVQDASDSNLSAGINEITFLTLPVPICTATRALAIEFEGCEVTGPLLA